MSDVFDKTVEYAREVGIPEEYLEDVVFKAEMCCESPYGEGVCAENTKSIIDEEAKKYD